MQRGFLLRADDRARKRKTQTKKSKSLPNNLSPSPQEQQQQQQSHRREVNARSVSQDLIALENPQTEKAPSVLLVHTEQQEQHHDEAQPRKPSRPLISIISNEQDDTTTASNTDMLGLPLPTKPLMEVMEPNSTVKEKDEFLFQERVTTYSSGVQRVEMVERTESSPQLTKSSSTFESTHLAVSNATMISEDSPSLTSTTPMTLLEFQQMLARMKWKNEESTDVHATVATWNSGQATWAWQWLLRLDGTKHHVLVNALLYHHPWTLPIQLQSETPQDRAHSLQLLQWIQDYLTATKSPRPNKGHHVWINLSCVDDWLDTILVRLTAMMGHRRTILAQQAWTTSALIIAKFAASSSLPPLDTLNHLLSVQIQWKQAKKTSPKTQAQITLLQDWIQVNQTCRDRQDQVTWRQNILGIQLEHCVGFGGLEHLFCSESSPRETIVGSALCQDEFWNLLDCSLQTKDGTTVSILWRGILAHVATFLEHLDTNTATKTNIIDKILELLPKINTPSDWELAISILKLLWSDNDGLPAIDHKSHTGPALPIPLERLWSCIPHSNLIVIKQQSDTKLEVWDPLFSFLAQYIIQAPDSVAIVDNLLLQEGITPSTCRILSTILTNIPACSCPTVAHDDDDEDGSVSKLRDHIQDIMIKNLPTSTLMRTFWLSCDTDMLQVWAADNCHQWIPKVLKLLYQYNIQTDEISRDTVSTISSILTKVLECCCCVVPQSLVSMVNGVVTFLISETSSCQDSATDYSNGAFCSTFCTPWRVLLLEKQNVPDTAFANTILAVATAVCDHPSSVATLAFFGALLGDSVPTSVVVEGRGAFRIMLAMESLLSFCGNKLEEQMVRGSDSILTRLSPLLLLRRVPSAYFTLARVQARNLESNKIQKSSGKVEQYMMSVFELPSTNYPQFPVTPEERRLAAEVAGRSFAFGQGVSSHPPTTSTDKTFTIFARICWPIFQDLIQAVRTSNLKSMQIPLVKKARLALYAVCHSIQKGIQPYDEPSDQEYYKAASFAFYAVSIDLAIFSDDVANEIIQLQRGAMEFFAICLVQFLAQEKLNQRGGHCRNGSYVADIELHRSETDAISRPLGRIWQAIVNILQSGNLRREDEWICLAENDHGNPVYNVVRTPSIQARTCLWNVLALVAQRSDDKDGSLAIFADLTLCWIAEWANQQTSLASTVHHPVCSVAAMQAVFTIITRSKSLECLRRGGDSRDNFKLLYCWALRELENAESAKEIHPMGNRAALKLILALLTLVSMAPETDSETSFGLDLEQINDTIAILHLKLKSDVEDDTKVLSKNILSVLGFKV